jgi:hypothetical protein
MIHLPVVIEKVHFSPCTNFTNFSGLRDDDRENFFLLPFTSHPRLTHRQDRNVSLKLRTSNRGIYKFWSQSVASQFSLLVVTRVYTIVWNHVKFVLIRTWQLKSQRTACSACCRSHRHARLKTQMLSWFLTVMKATAAVAPRSQIMQSDYSHCDDIPQFSSTVRFQSFAQRWCWRFQCSGMSCRVLW